MRTDMNSRDRFRETMRYGAVDRVPYYEEGIRSDVFQAWRRQGLKRQSDFKKMFRHDRREEIHPDLEPLPRLHQWPSSADEINRLQRRLNPQDSRRLPRKWPGLVQSWKLREHPVMLHVHRGLFLSMGVEGWDRFSEVIELLGRDPARVHEALMIQGGFAAHLADRVLRDVKVDAAFFSEPIAENRGPLISPKMYAEIVLPSYDPVLEVLSRHGVEIIIFISWANPRRLLPAVLERGFNCLWAYEANPQAMDYRDLRREFGRDLRLIGGIDLDVLRRDKDAIRREVEEKVPPLLADGGYIPMLDGRVRVDVPFENYVFFKRLLEKMIRPSGESSSG
jgi:uroporphyrinogen decarboxylase